MRKIKGYFKAIEFSSFDLKGFWIGFLAIFFMVSVQHIGIRLPKSFSLSQEKVSYKSENLIETIKPKLLKNVNQFKLKQKEVVLPYQISDVSYPETLSYLVVNYDTGEVLSGRKISKKVPIASLTKIMTAIVALDLASPTDVFEVSRNAADQIPTKIGVVPGQKMTLEELLNASLLTSANDATEVIKEELNKRYGENIFIKSMNEKAKILGLSNTHFANPQGFDSKENFSSAEDLAVLSHYALTYPLFAKIVKKDYQFLEADSNHKQFNLYNWNGLLNVYPGIEGVKIGNSRDAGTTMVTLSQREDRRIMVVLLGTSDIFERDLLSARLLDLGFAKYGIKSFNLNSQKLLAKYLTWKQY